jgi:hypothetical protein
MTEQLWQAATAVAAITIVLLALLVVYRTAMAEDDEFERQARGEDEAGRQDDGRGK